MFGLKFMFEGQMLRRFLTACIEEHLRWTVPQPIEAYDFSQLGADQASALFGELFVITSHLQGLLEGCIAISALKKMGRYKKLCAPSAWKQNEHIDSWVEIGWKN